MQGGRPRYESSEIPEGSAALIAVGLSSEERNLLDAFGADLEAATGVRLFSATTVEGGLGRLSVLRGRGTPCVGLVSAGVGEREALRMLRWFSAPTGLAPVVVLGGRNDGALLAEALACRACDVLLRHELDVDRLARSIRLAAELARRDLADEALRERLRGLEELLDTVWEVTEEGLLLVDGDRRVQRCNPAAERLFSLPGRELLGASFGALGWVSSSPESTGAAQFAVAEIPVEIERHEEGRLRVGLKVRPLGRRAGAQERARVVSIRPQTDPAEAGALTAEARHFSGLGRFLAGAAHDCSNLLTPLLGYCELLLTKLPEKSGLAGYAREIERSARLAAELMHRLRDTARNQPIAEGSVVPDRCLVDLTGLLRSLVGRGIEVVEELRGGDLEVSVRSGEIEQIVLNLAANARDAMPLGGRLVVRTRAESEERWSLEIEDTGGGISPDNLPRLFDPAFTTKALGKGTGLGLWIVRSIVEQVGGTVSVSSTLGKGSTVRVELPARPSRATPDLRKLT